MMDEFRPWRILLVEDNLADVCLLRLALNEAGLKFEITTLCDGNEARDFVCRRGKYREAPCPDLAVLDLRVPMSSGAEVLEAIRGSEHLRHLPAIIMTSFAPPEELSRVEALGIERQIIKSCNFDEFLKVGEEIKEVLERSRQPNCKSRGA